MIHPPYHPIQGLPASQRPSLGHFFSHRLAQRTGFFFDWHPKIGHCNAKNKDLFYWPPKFNLTIKKASFFFLPCNSQQYRNNLIFNAFDSVTHHFFNQAD
jgi:hypothetical protein